MRPTSSVLRAPSRGEWLLVVAVGVLLTAVLTYPTVPGFFSEGRLDSGDGRFSIWNIAWIDHALLTNPRHLLDANIFYPHTGTLAYSELNLVAGLLGLPAYALTHNAFAAINSAILIGFILAFVGMWFLVRRLTGSTAAGVVAATMFTFCPYVQVHTAHIQLLMIFGFPLVLLAWHRLHEAPTTRRAIELGVALAVTGLACAYYGIFAGVALAVAALALAVPRWRYWAALAGAAAVTVVLVLPVFVPYARARAATGVTGQRSAEEAQTYAATLATYRSSPAYAHRWIGPPAAESVFPGLLLLGLAALGVRAVWKSGTATERRIVTAYLLVAGVAVWASFGPAAGLYTVLSHTVPEMSMLRAPSRFGIVVVFALAVVAGFGVRHVSTRRTWRAWALVPLVALELAAVPWPLRPDDPVPQAYRLLAELPRGPVVEFPFMYQRSDYHNHTRYMFASTYHWQPLVNGYSDIIPPDFDEIALPINAFPSVDSFRIMRERSVRYVVFHLDRYDGIYRDILLARFPPFAPYLRRLTTDRDVWLYEIVGWPGPGAP